MQSLEIYTDESFPVWKKKNTSEISFHRERMQIGSVCVYKSSQIIVLLDLLRGRGVEGCPGATAAFSTTESSQFLG